MKLATLLMLVLFVVPATADMGAPAQVRFTSFDRLELRDPDGEDTLAWEFDTWWGTGLQKLWLKSEGERTEGQTEEAELQLLYSRAISPYWDLQLGGSVHLGPPPHRSWLVLGFDGLAPGFIETELALLLGDQGRTALRASFEPELLITQRLWLAPELKFELYGRDDPDSGVGSGLSAVEVGLRLGYTLERKFAPYVGIHAYRSYGGTARYARAAGDAGDDVQFTLGFSAWF